MPTILLTNVTIQRGAYSLPGLTMAVPQGITHLVGPNGSGKSTLLRHLATIDRFKSGSATFGSFDYCQSKDVKNIRRRLGYLPQAFTWGGGDTVLQVMYLMCWMKEVRKSERRVEVDDLLESLRLGDKRSSRFNSLSGGLQRRVGIAQAFLGHPELVILDEPFAGLDEAAGSLLDDLLFSRANAAAIIITGHEASRPLWQGRPIRTISMSELKPLAVR